MGSPQEAIFGKLSHTVAVTTLCSTRIFPGFVDFNVRLPAVSYVMTYDPREHSMGRDPNIGSPHFQVDIYSTSYAQTLTLSNAVMNALRDYSGSTWGNIQRIFFEGKSEMVEQDPETRLITHRAIHDYIVWWNT